MTPKQIVYGDHAEQRLRERGMRRTAVRWLLAQGVRERQPTLTGGPQRWGCRGYLGHHEARVVFVEDAHTITVITVEWLDQRDS